MKESNIEKIREILNYLDDGEYYNDRYGVEYIMYKFTYNYIDIIFEQYNYKELTGSISNKLIMASIIASSALGIFTSFKIWINKDSFNTASDLFIMLSNFSIALMTGYSKSYVDNRRNENIHLEKWKSRSTVRIQ